MPVPISLQNEVEAAFLKEGRVLGIDFESDADGALQACAGGTRSYFRVDLPDGRKLIHLMKDDVPFSVQFGRYVPLQTIIDKVGLRVFLQTSAGISLEHQLPARLEDVHSFRGGRQSRC